LEDLIVMKESAARPKDLEDIKVLKALKKKRDG
jgi:predicted nucleotidyltransferase